jgi:uncharacterized lipoprotein YddW (UPF0748 family)
MAIAWVMTLVCLVLTGGSGTATYGATPESGVIDGCQYASDAEARAVWRPMGSTAPVGLLEQAGGKALQLTCNFTAAKMERASWDRSVALDLTTCRGIEFQVYCRNPAPVSYFSFYLQSGDGWYHASFYPESTQDWTTVTLDKTAFGIEGSPAGWGQIRSIRISAWRGQEQDTEFFLNRLRVAGTLDHDTLVAIVRAESVAQKQPEEARNIAQFTETLGQMLQKLGLDYAIVNDLEVTAGQLQAAKLVILPYNPSLPYRTVAGLRQFMQGGGKLLVFYTVPERLRDLLGMQIGQSVKELRSGQFASIRPVLSVLPAAPPLVGQRSWNITSVRPVAGRSQVFAEWLDDQGQSTGRAAVVGSRNALVMTHVLLPDDAEKKGRFLLAMVGYLVPELWPQAIQSSLDCIGALGTARNFSQAEAMLESLIKDKAKAREALAAARSMKETAQELAAQREFSEALDQASAARRRLVEAWSLAQSPLPGEFRAFWCHRAFGVEGLSWDEAAQRLAQNGFTAIFPNMLWGGAAFYDSKVLPVSPEITKRGDQITQCLEAAHRHGLEVHVWKVNWNLGHAAPRHFIDQLRLAGRLQANSRGQEQTWLCPSHPDNQQLEIDSLLEVARNYDVDGLHFDYIRYPDSDHCYCAGCRKRFQQTMKTDLPLWPREVLTDGAWRPQWLEWRRSHITRVVRTVSEQAHALKPNLKISAAVFTNWTTDRDGVGQDWKLWCENGWLDFVCPMDYTSSHRQFENMVARQVDWAGSTPCYPGIGESASASKLGVDGVIEQIQITRRYNTRGFIIFNYGVTEANELLPMLGSGITKRVSIQ